MQTPTRRRIFQVTAAAAGLVYVMYIELVLALLIVLWLPEATILSIIDDLEPDALAHRAHELAISITGWALLLGVVVQLHKPQRKVAAIQHALSIPLIVLVFDVSTGIFTIEDTIPLLAPVLVVALIHPSRREVFAIRGFDGVMVGLTGLVALPWLWFAFAQAQMQLSATPGDVHAEQGHWAWMASFAVLLVAWALIGSSHAPGWRFTAWIVGMSSIIFAVYSLTFSGLASVLSPPWAIAAIMWALLYVVATERRSRRRVPMTPAAEVAADTI